MDSVSNPLEEIDIEYEELPVKELISDIDVSKLKVKDIKLYTEFITGLISNSYRFLVLKSLNNEKTILINGDKLKVIAMFIENKFHLEDQYTQIRYGEGYACDLPDFMLRTILEKTIPIVYIRERDFSKDVMDNLAKEFNIYPYPLCINSLI